MANGYLTPDEAAELGVPWVPRENEPAPYLSPDEARATGVAWTPRQDQVSYYLQQAGGDPVRADALARADAGYPRDYVSPFLDVTGAPYGTPQSLIREYSYNDRQLIASMPSSQAPTPDPVSTEGWRDWLGPIVGALPIPGAGIIGDIITPGPPGFQQPRLPPAGGGLPMPAPRPGVPAPRPMPPPLPPRPIGSGRTAGAMGRLSPYINPRTGRNIPWAKIARIGGLAAAAGLSLEAFIAMYGVPRDPPTMNPLNPRALRRAQNRIGRFGQFVKRHVYLERHGPRLKKGKKRR